MPTLLSTGNRGSTQGRSWMPTEATTPSLTREQMDQMSISVYNQANQKDLGVSAWESVARWGMGTAVDLADTVASSPLNPMDVKRGDVWSTASPEMQRYYERHRPLIEGSSAVVGGVLTMVGAEALVIPRISAGLASSTMLTGTRLWRATEAWNVESRAAMLEAQVGAAASGESFTLFGTSAGRRFALNRTIAEGAKAIRTTPIDYGIMWSNEAFNSGDWQKEGFWVGVGAALGGSVGSLGARSLVRETANSPLIRDLRARPMALSGVSNDLLSPVDRKLVERIDPVATSVKESALTTQLFIAKRSATPAEIGPKDATRLNAVRSEFDQMALDSTQKIVSKGVSGVDVSRSKAKKLPEVAHIIDTVSKQDPFVFHGLAEMGVVTGNLDEALEGRKAYIASLPKQAEVMEKKGVAKEAERLNRLHKVLQDQDGYVMVNGTWMTQDSDLVKAAVAHDPEKVDARSLTTKINTEEIQIRHTLAGDMTIDASLTPRFQKSLRAVDVERMSLKDRLILDTASEKLVRRLSKKGSTVRFKLTDEGAASWYTLDLAANILERGGSIEYGLKNIKIANLDDIQRQSLRLKSKSALMHISPMGRYTPEIRFKYNLPQATPMELIEDPAGDSFKQWLARATGSEGTAKEFADALSDSRSLAGIDLLKTSGSAGLRIDGNMLRFNRDKNGTYLRPLLGYFDRRNRIGKIMEGGHSQAMTLRKAEKTAILMKSQSHVGQLANDLVMMTDDINKAMDIKGLHSDQVTGLGGGFTQAASEILPQRFKARDNDTILAASKLQEATERHGLATYHDLMDSPDIKMADVVTLLHSTGNAAKRVMIDQYFTMRSGWDISGARALDNELFGFSLKDTLSNRKRLGMTAGDKWTGEEMLTNGRLGRAIAVDADVMDAIAKFNKVTDFIVQGDNPLRQAKGLRDLEYKPFFTPPVNTKDSLIAYVHDAAGKVVPGNTISAKSQAEFDTLYKRTLDELEPGQTIRTQEQNMNLRDIWDEAQMDWIDPGFSSATTNIGHQEGGLAGAFVKQGAFMDALDWAKRKVVAQSQDTLRSLMDETLMVARAQSVAERGANPGKGRTVYDMYEQMLTGKSEGYAESAILDKGFKKVETVIDGILANSSIMTPARWVTNLAQNMRMNPMDLNGAKSYRQIAERMGEYTPFASAVEFAESRGFKRPPTVRGIATKMNTVAASVLLRWFEIPHAAINLIGLMATIPTGVLAGHAPITTFSRIKGQEVGILDSGKIIGQAMKDMVTNRKMVNDDWAHMFKNGDATQSVIEYHRNLAAVDSQAGFNKWAKNIDKYISILSETSESWSRQFSHFVGLRLADYHGLTGMAERHNFAREIANAAIADYAPINRPELFGSGFGSMLGLFQSYALNHYSKMFRYMEKGDYKKMGLVAGIQATMFGLPGTYGMGVLMDMRDSQFSTGSDPTMIDLIYQHFGPVLGGAIVHGSISEVSQLALWSRGDMNFRIPGASGTLPALDIGTKIARGFVDGYTGFINAMPGEGTHALLEAVQRNMPNRIMRSWLTLLNNGQEIDAYGQVMTETQTWMDTVARTLGVRSVRQQAELESFYAGKAAMERDAGAMDKVRESFRSAVRSNKGDMEKISPIQYYNDYLKAGGNPRTFKTWIKNLLRESGDARSAQQLKKSLTTQRSILETWRYGAYGAWNVD